MVLFTQNQAECATVKAERLHHLLGHPTCLMASGLSFLVSDFLMLLVSHSLWLNLPGCVLSEVLRC